MANPEHLANLKEGKVAWNRWRELNPELLPDLTTAYLLNLNLSGMNLRGVDFTASNLRFVDLTDADLSLFTQEDLLSGCSLSWCDLSGAKLANANFAWVRLQGTVFANTSLSEVLGLEKCYHIAPSVIDNDTHAQSGKLPIGFLRGVGLSDYQIEYHKLDQPGLSNAEINDIIYRIYDLRAHQAIQINPLFISYTHTDNAFVDAIEKRLTDKGVRFWRDIHHATSGRLEKQVDRAMRLNDTVLLVLSQNSVESDWVEHEAASARELEQERGKDVLCPVALDDAWKNCNWPKKLRRQIEDYNILDFSGWQDDGVFDRMFVRLLDGLDLFYKK